MTEEKKSQKQPNQKSHFNEHLPLSIYQNGIRTALNDLGEGSCEKEGMWQEEKLFIKDSEVVVGGEKERKGKEKRHQKCFSSLLATT